MDVVGTVKSLCSLSASVLKWLDETIEKEEALTSLSATAKRINDVLERFKDVPTIEPALLNAFLGLGDMLSRTKEHLEVWSCKRKKLSLSKAVGFFVPSQVTKRLVQDEQQLANQLVVILFAMSSVSFLKEHHSSLPPSEEIKDSDATQFWGDFVGAKISFARTERFSEALAICFGARLEPETRARLLLYLDEFHVGGVSRCSLERFIGPRSLQEAIENFVHTPHSITITDEGSPPDVKEHKSFQEAIAESSINAPELVAVADKKSQPGGTELTLIIWIDDELDSISGFLKHAEEKNVLVVHHASTALAKAWIEDNEELLLIADGLGKVRFISDNVRFEPESEGAETFLNIAAGENILRYLRGRQFKAPVLIYCGGSLEDTKYVLNYDAAGSTCSGAVVERYIGALAEGAKDEDEWKGFDRWV